MNGFVSNMKGIDHFGGSLSKIWCFRLYVSKNDICSCNL